MRWLFVSNLCTFNSISSCHSSQVSFFLQERQALKKLENIRNDHSLRLTQLQKDQLEDRRKGELIEMNSNLVDKALMMIRSALANQVNFIIIVGKLYNFK